MRLLIPDLLPGTNYSIQVRADDGSLQSEWSNVFVVETTADQTPPETPVWSNIADWVVNGDTFVAAWDALDLNIENNRDFSHYELELSDNSTSVVVRVDGNSYTLTFEQNRIFFGSPKATVKARVRSVDAVGNTSAWNAQKSATNPPPSPVDSVSVNALYDAIDVNWEDSDIEDDFARYLVQVSTTSASTGFNTVFSGPSRQYQHATTMFTTEHWFRVYAVDKFGSLSTAVVSSAIKPKSSMTLDSTPPDIPTGLTATIANNSNGVGARASLSWNQVIPTENDLAGFRVRWRRVGDSEYSQTDFSFEDRAGIVELQLAYMNYEFQIRSYDWMGNFSAWSTTVTANSPGNVAPPKTVGVVSTADRTSIQYRWTPSTALDLKEYEAVVSTSSTFASGNVTFKTGTGASLASGGLTPETTYYFRVRAIDTAGALGAWSDTHTKSTLGQLTAEDIGAVLESEFLALSGVVDGKGKVYYQTTAPAGDPNSLWIDITDGWNLAKRWNGSTWVTVQDADIQNAADLAAQAKTAADTAQGAADAAQDAADAAQTKADAAEDAAIDSSKVYIQSTTPVGRSQDLWIDTTNAKNIPKRWNGTSWVVATDQAAIDTAIAAAAIDATAKANTAKTDAVVEVKTLWGHPSNTTLIDGGDIFTNSIRAQSLILSDMTNYISDPEMKDAGSWITSSGSFLTPPSGTTPGFLTINIANASANSHFFDTNNWNCAPNDEFWVTAEVSSPATNTGVVEFRATVREQNAGGSTIAYRSTYPTADVLPNDGSWVTVFGRVQMLSADAATFKFGPYFRSTVAGDKGLIRNVKIMKRVGGNLVVDGAIQTSHVSTVGLDAAVIKFGQMSGERIEANTITTEKMLVGQGANTVANGGFETGLAAPHNISNFVNYVSNHPTVHSGRYALRLEVNQDLGGARRAVIEVNGALQQPEKHTKVVPGERWRFECWARSNTQTYIEPAIIVSDNPRTKNVGAEWGIGKGFELTGAWQRISVEYTIPDDPTADYATVIIYAGGDSVAGDDIFLDDMSLTKMVTGELIVNGSLTIGSVGGLSDSLTDATASAVESRAQNGNSTFTDWTSTYPDFYGAWFETPIKETTYYRTAGHAVRYNGAVQAGLSANVSFGHMPFISQYAVVEVDVMLLDPGDSSPASFSGAGVLLDWKPQTGAYRNHIALKDIVPTPEYGKWYQLTQIVKKPSDTPTEGFSGFIMANYTPLGTITNKNIVFDRVAIRAASNAEIEAYETGAAGTRTRVDDWTFEGQTTIDGGHIETDTIDVKKLKAGSTFTQNLQVASNFTVGTATQNGTIQSYGYTATTGWKLDKTGLVINQGSVRAETLIGGTLTSSTGVINLGNGAGLVTEGGFIRSNTYGGNVYNENATAGFFLSDGNLHIPDGNISAKALKAGTITGTNEIVLSGAGAKITGGSWSLSGNGLSIPNGGIQAQHLTLQKGGANLIPAEWANFSLPPSFYEPMSVSKPGAVSGDVTIDITKGFIGNHSLKFNMTATGATGQYMQYNTGHYIPVDENKTYIYSAYVYQTGGTANTIYYAPVLGGTGGTRYMDGSEWISATDTWVRLSFVFTPEPGETEVTINPRILFPNGTTGTNRVFYVDGQMLEEKMTNADTPSTFALNGYTAIDGGIIKTGSISSTLPAKDANGNNIPDVAAWQINTSGNAVFGDALIRGRLMIGYQNEPAYNPTPDAETGVVPPENLDNVSMIQSYNYNPEGGTGWSIRSNGMAEFRQLTADSVSAEAIAAVNPEKLKGGIFGANWILSSNGVLHAGDSEQIVVTHRSRVGNVTTLTVESHNRLPGDRIIEYSLFPSDPTFAVSDAVITEVTATTIKYTNTGANVTNTPLVNSHVVAEGRAVELSKDGLTLLGQDGATKLISLPTDTETPAVFNGDIEALSLVVKDDLVLQGANNYIASGSKIRLAETPSGPTTPPTVLGTWKFNDTWLGNDYTAGRKGLVYDSSFGGRFMTVNRFWGTQFFAYKTDGSFQDNIQLSTYDSVSFTKIGSSFYFIQNIGDAWRVRNYTLSGTEGNQIATPGAVDWEYDQHAHAAFGVTKAQWIPAWTPYLGNPAMANDGTNLYIARMSKSGKIVVQKFNPADGSLISTTITTGGTHHKNMSIHSFEIGNFDFGAQRWVMSLEGYGLALPSVAVFNNAGVQQVNEGWETPNEAELFGLTYTGSATTGKFVGLSENNRHYEFTNVSKNTETEYWVQGSFIDADDTRSKQVTSTTGSGGIVTLTVGTGHGFEAGDLVRVGVTGVTGPWEAAVIQSITTTTVSVSGSYTGTTTTSGWVTNVFETPKGPAYSFVAKRRAGMVFKQAGMQTTTLPVAPSDVRFWVGTTAGATHLQTGGIKGIATLTLYDSPDLGGTTNTAQPFPKTEPSSIYSENGKFEVNADGFGLFGATQDATTNPGNKPPLRVGDPANAHLRIDGNEILAMDNDNSQGTLFLNGGGGEVRGYNFTVTNQLNVTGVVVGTTNFPGGTSINSAGGVVIGGGLSVGQNINLSGTFAGQTKFAGGTSAESDGSFIVGTRPQAGSANVNFGAEGKLRIISSSLRFKKDVEDFEYSSDTILDLKPRRYRRIDSEDSSITYPEIGFIAEEAESLGLEEWVEREPDGTVFSFDYYKWVVAHQIVLREQREKIAALEAAVASLTA